MLEILDLKNTSVNKFEELLSNGIGNAKKPMLQDQIFNSWKALKEQRP